MVIAIFVGVVVALGFGLSAALPVWTFLKQKSFSEEKRTEDFALKVWPWDPNSIRINKKAYPQDDVAWVLEVTQEKFESLYGPLTETARDFIDRHNIVWEDGYPFESGKHPYPVYGYYERHNLHVGYKPDQPIYETALAYEFVRALKRSMGHKDWDIPNRGGDKWPDAVWDLIDEANKEVQEDLDETL